MLQAKDFSAWIEIENVETPEFGVEVSENEQDVSCWIPSEVGKKFSVHWTNNSLLGLTGGGVQVDGHKCGFEVVASDTRPLTAFMDGIPESNTKTRPFVFTPLELTDDDQYLESASHPQLGLIRLEIWRVDVGGGMASSTVAVPSTHKVHERAKKAMNQQIAFGTAVEHAQVQSAQIRRVGNGPLATFSFKYRSLALLRANGIAPLPERKEKRKASVSPERSHDEEGDPDVEEAARLKTRLEALTSKRAKKNPTTTVKSEPIPDIVPRPPSEAANNTLKPETGT